MKKFIYSILTLLATSVFMSTSVSASTNTGHMMRYYNTQKGTYLFTVNAGEIEKIKKLSYLQPQGTVFTTAKNGTKMYRFYHKATGRYVFTGKQDEISKMKKNGWVYEGFAFYSGGSASIYRLYHHATGQHFYTGNINEISAFTRKGWVNEGIGFYASTATRTDVYETLTYEKTEKDVTMRLVVNVKNDIIQNSQEQVTGRFTKPFTDYQFSLVKVRLQQQIESSFKLAKLRAVNGVTVTTNLTKEFFQVKVVYDYTKVSASQLKASGLGYVDVLDEMVFGDRLYLTATLLDAGLKQQGYTRK